MVKDDETAGRDRSAGASSMRGTGGGQGQGRRRGQKRSRETGGFAAEAPVHEDVPSPPPYERNASALVVFANPYFYDGMEAAAELYRQKREEAFTFVDEHGTRVEMTVDDVRREYNIPGDPKGAIELFRKINASDVRILAYYAVVPTEQLLDGELMLLSGDAKEIRRYNRNKGYNLPTLTRIFNQFQSSEQSAGRGSELGYVPSESRNSQICIVTGSSGSGKTYFCLRYLPRFYRRSQEESVLIAYLQPSAASLHSLAAAKKNKNAAAAAAAVSGVSGEEAWGEEDDEGTPIGTRIGREVVKLLRGQIQKKIHRFVDSALEMRVCLIFDEAGALSLRDLFEEPKVLNDIYSHVLEHLAVNVVMAVAGTGVTGKLLKSKSDAYFFRLTPWGEADVRGMLEPREDELRLEEGEDVQTVVNAIYAQTKLRALTTNARSAHFLVEAILNLCSVHVQEMWRVKMDAWTAAIVTKVVHGYIAENGIQMLRQRERALVAAAVFHALRDAKCNSSALPQFPVLGPVSVERAVAISLLTYNVERVSDELETQLLAGESYAVSVTPAIAIVLFTMAGLQVSMVPGLRAEEEVAGLYAARRLILDRLDSHVREHGSSSVEALKDKLAGIRLVVLQKQIQAPRPLEDREREDDEGVVRVPLVPPASILLNGEKASFADVIAPYMLLQAKYTSGGKAIVNVGKELDKCCLLDGCRDDRVLRGLLALWRGGLTVSVTADRSTPQTEELPYQTSNAYPENLVKYGTHTDVINYAPIASFECKISHAGQQLDLPTFEKKEKVTFVLVTNAPSIHLKDLDLTITPRMLDERAELNVSTLTTAEQVFRWESLKARIERRARIEFLFTRSST